VFALCTLPGSVLGVIVADKVSRPGFDVVMGVVLLAVGILLLRGFSTVSEQPRPGALRVLADREGQEYRYHADLRLGALLSVGVGFVSSFLGIGGGVLHVPLLVGVLGFPTHIATATSHFVLSFMALVATLTHVVAGTFHNGVGLRRAAALSVGVIVGAQLGAWLSQRLSGRLIQKLLALGLLVLAARLVLSVIL
jgi:uncharacterized membrane protein YfcA